MIEPSVLPLFFTAIFFLVISPGPDLLLISTYSSTKGFNSGFMLSLGIFIAGIVQTALVAFGLGQLMQVVPVFTVLIKTIGAIYLAWLGFKLLKSWYLNQQEQTTLQGSAGGDDSNMSLISKGLLNNLLNPKAILFFSLFLPQFTTGAGQIMGQIIFLGFLLSTFALVVNIVFAFSFSKLGSAIGKKFNMGRHIDGLLGLIFVGLAARLATSK